LSDFNADGEYDLDKLKKKSSEMGSKYGGKMDQFKNHRYVNLSSLACRTEFVFMGSRIDVDFCPYGDSLRDFGFVLVGICSVLGLLYVFKV